MLSANEVIFLYLSSMELNEASGLDGVGAELLKHCSS